MRGLKFHIDLHHENNRKIRQIKAKEPVNESYSHNDEKNKQESNIANMIGKEPLKYLFSSNNSKCSEFCGKTHTLKLLHVVAAKISLNAICAIWFSDIGLPLNFIRW